MKNKYFWPIILISAVIIMESVVLLSRNQAKTILKTGLIVEENIPTETVKVVDAVSFGWVYEAGKATLELKANKDVAIDALDLYIGYKGVKINSVTNVGELPKPTFSKISTDKSLVVLNYNITEADGFKLISGQSVKIFQLDVSLKSGESIELSIQSGPDTRTQVVENGTAKVLPFSSKNLIVESSL